MTREPYANDAQAERATELLVGQALEGLEPDEGLELESLIAAGHSEKGCTICMAAAVLHLGMMTSKDFEPMPFAIRATLEARGQAWARVTSRVTGVRRAPVHLVRAYGPWLAAAACLTVAAFAWLPRGGNPVETAQRDPNHFTVQWASWTPELSGVTGHVCWSDCKECGFMSVVGLPRNDPSHQQYQLWIVDDRGMSQRISGGVFDSNGGEVTMPIRPGIPVHSPKVFAITLEPAGGTWVSDLSRKVAIAQRD